MRRVRHGAIILSPSGEAFTYLQDEERMEDNCKLWHSLKGPDGVVHTFDFSPYEIPFPNDLFFWLALGMPDRAQCGLNGPIHQGDMDALFCARFGVPRRPTPHEIRAAAERHVAYGWTSSPGSHDLNIRWTPEDNAAYMALYRAALAESRK
jgi:hypothetical protein